VAISVTDPHRFGANPPRIDREMLRQRFVRPGISGGWLSTSDEEPRRELIDLYINEPSLFQLRTHLELGALRDPPQGTQQTVR
jgi:hypothetical protein